MSQCRICGDEGASYDVNYHQTICEDCKKSSSVKVGRTEFDAIYWGSDSDVPMSTRREFYDDYLSSTSDLESYIKETTIPCI